jgi:serine/threonine protein kinase
MPESTSLIPGGTKNGVIFRANHRIVCLASQPLWRSRFTKFRVAVDMNGQAYAVKQLLSDRASLVPAWENQPAESQLAVTPMAMIVREVSLARFLGGHLVPHQVLRYGSEIFIVMPLMQDTLTTLAADMPREDRAAVARGIARQLARQLLAFHQRDVSHTDVKLSNALWDHEGRAILCDFGLATALPSGLSQKRHRGTPRCSAPEVALGLPFTTKVDSWSLGILLTEFHIGEKAENPFSASEKDLPNGPSPMHARWYFAATQHQAFAVWRRRVMRGDQLLFTELLMAVEEDTIWGRFFKPIVHQDPELAALVIGRMLDDTSYTRASMQDVVIALGDLDDATAPADVRWSKLPTRDPRRQYALHALRQLADRLQQP